MGELRSHSVQLVGGIEALVAVELDAGGEPHHECGQGGDLVQHVLVLLQQTSHVG